MRVKIVERLKKALFFRVCNDNESPENQDSERETAEPFRIRNDSERAHRSLKSEQCNDKHLETWIWERTGAILPFKAGRHEGKSQ